MSIVKENPRETIVKGSYDVIVCGAGPAGTAAAIGAARMGASVLLIEGQGQLGGIWTSGLLSWFLDSRHEDGFIHEMIQELSLSGYGRQVQRQDFICDTEQLKLYLERKTLSAGVRIRFHTSIVSTLKKKKSLTHVITESKGGREAWEGKIFIDATGDGDVGALAGCSFDLGHPDTGKTQPMSLIVQVDGVSPEDMIPYENTLYNTKTQKSPIFSQNEENNGGVQKRIIKERFYKLLRDNGLVPSYAQPSLFHIDKGLYILMINHQYDVSSLDGDALTRATLEAREEIHQIADKLRSFGGIWKDFRIVNSAPRIGVREGRRLHGLYTVTLNDMLIGRKHDDSVCRVKFGIDVHATNKKTISGFENEGHKVQPYDIPVGALISRDIENLLMAGRCISGDFYAHSSYRVTGDAVVLGEGAGRFAAGCIKNDFTPGNYKKGSGF